MIDSAHNDDDIYTAYVEFEGDMGEIIDNVMLASDGTYSVSSIYRHHTTPSPSSHYND